MTARTNVRTHTRRTASGKTTTVRRHTRRGLVSYRHAGRSAARAFRAFRRKHKIIALGLGVLAVAELTACLALNGMTLILATAAILAGAAAFLAAQASGMPVPVRGPGRKKAPRRASQERPQARARRPS